MGCGQDRPGSRRLLAGPGRPYVAAEKAYEHPLPSLQDMERHAILDALARCAGNQTRAAELLGIPRRTFCTRLMEYNVPRPRRRAPHRA
jgi:two-component system, NtrC family, response regulator AtoC